MKIAFKKYPFTPILGWSSSRYELFSRCKRQYFYQYYSKYVPGTSFEKMKQLKELSSVPLEIGNIIHHVIEKLLERLRQSDSPIDQERFLVYARKLTDDMFAEKTFIEEYYGQIEKVDKEGAKARIVESLTNFMQSQVYSWIWLKALKSVDEWLIEPSGYGETRIDNLKAYCKMDFLFPIGDELYILDWKSGKESREKHSNQLLGYALAAQLAAPGLETTKIIPKIIYMNPTVSEFTISLNPESLNEFKTKVASQTKEMYQLCDDIEHNRPFAIDNFPRCEHTNLCKYCNFQEVCEPYKASVENSSQGDELPF